jgi:hypothetical protein
MLILNNIDPPENCVEFIGQGVTPCEPPIHMNGWLHDQDRKEGCTRGRAAEEGTVREERRELGKLSTLELNRGLSGV